MPKPNDPIRLYSMVTCPFAQRTRIHLDLLELPFELEDFDICHPRPDWFLQLNPRCWVVAREGHYGA